MAGIGDRLRDDRQAAGLTIRELAHMTGMSFSYITKIETCRAKGISADKVIDLATALRKDVLEYLSLSGAVPPPLSGLIADRRSRDFLRKLISTSPGSISWMRLQEVLDSPQSTLPLVRNGKKRATAPEAEARSDS